MVKGGQRGSAAWAGRSQEGLGVARWGMAPALGTWIMIWELFLGGGNLECGESGWLGHLFCFVDAIMDVDRCACACGIRMSE